MADDGEFSAYVLDQLGRLTPSVRRMFGGVALYDGAAMFGFLYQDRLYFKVDDGNRVDYDAATAPALLYAPDKKRQVIGSLREVPADVTEDADALCAWARKAVAAARRKKSRSTSKTQ